jgi:Tol biopolymer transport system component
MKWPAGSRARRICGLALSFGMASGAAAFNYTPNAGAGGGRQQVRPSNHTPEPAGKIAFASERDGNYEIYVMNPNGGGQARLTTNPAVDREPAWSPDGTRIAFASDRGGAGTDIYVVSLATPDTPFTPAARLTNNAADDGQPAWSPDGSKIAFVSSRTGDDEIFVMNADGTGQTNLTNNPFDDFDPAWSPDGTKIAFASNRDGTTIEASEDVFTMDANGGGQTNITRSPTNDRHPAWAGGRIAFQRTREGQDDIFVMNPDGTGQTALTSDPAQDQEPALNGNGAQVVFASNRDGDFEIFSVSVGGGAALKLTSNSEDNDFEAAVQRQVPPVIGEIVSGTIQLASANATVNESAGRATVTVTRTGGTTGTAVVDYAATSGTASERGDFTTAIGTLTFAEGETAKTFTVFITNDAFGELDETINVTLSQATNASLGLSAGTLTITDDDEATAAANPIDDPEFFVRQHYIDFFNREPEPSGFAAWVGVLRGCPNQFNTSPTGPSAGCDRITVSSAFVRAPEYQLKGYYVIRFYLASLGRLPTYREFVRDIRRIDAPTGEEVTANRAAYAVEFTRREDFRAVYDPLSNQAYVDRLAQTSGVSPANRAQLVADLNSGAKTRAQVLREFVENQQFTAKEFNRGFVASQYYGYLRRDPEPTGFQAWLNYLNANPSDFRTMVNGFVNSQEYRSRFGNP